jgi:hypothetical protein
MQSVPQESRAESSYLPQNGLLGAVSRFQSAQTHSQ